MIYFQCDYEEGCHPAILKKLQETNLEQTVGYSMGSVLCKCKRKDKEGDRTIGCRCAFSGRRNADKYDGYCGSVKAVAGCNLR